MVLPSGVSAADTYSLTFNDYYDLICGLHDFDASFTAEVDLATPVTVRVTYTLNGDPYFTGSFTRGAGQATYSDSFGGKVDLGVLTYTVVVREDLIPEGTNMVVYSRTATLECVEGVLTASDSGGPVALQPGPDMVPIPEGSAVGLFVADTPAYWAPGLDFITSPPVMFKAGQTVWVTGATDSGFYEILLAGQTLWVPQEVMAPNPDAVWRNAPLPSSAS
jgi:hypothetical protein